MKSIVGLFIIIYFRQDNIQGLLATFFHRYLSFLFFFFLKEDNTVIQRLLIDYNILSGCMKRVIAGAKPSQQATIEH